MNSKVKKVHFGWKKYENWRNWFFCQNYDPLSLKFDENGPSGLTQM